jgi:transposase
MQDTVFALDLAKSVFELAVSHYPGQISQQHRMTRSQLLRFVGRQPPAIILMEACGTAHHWGREFRRLGHEVRLLPAHDVARYRRGGKTDATDTKALLEAGRNEAIRPVPVKSIEQQALTALHRLRSRWLATRTARINTIRGILRELGLLIPMGAKKVTPQVRAWIGDPETSIPAPLGSLLWEACEEVEELERRIRLVEVQLETLGKQIDIVARLRTIPGIGLLTGTALVAFVGDVVRFPSGRHFASFLGLTPREHSSGSIRRLGRISKHGDVYLRMLLIHGARAVLLHAKRRDHPDPLRKWALRLERTRGHNIATVALANRLARIAWAVWLRDRSYREGHPAS